MHQFQIYQVFKTKLWLNLKAEASRSYLGYAWWILEPTMYVIVLYFVFGFLIQRGAEYFVAFLLCGTIPFLWFSKTTANATSSISEAHNLISNIPMPKAFFPLVVVFQDCVKQALVFTLFFAFLIIYGIPPTIEWLITIPVIATQLLFMVAAALVCASITPFLPDFKYVVPTAILMTMLTSGVFYSYQVVLPEDKWGLFLLNPMANLIDSYRLVLLDSQQPHWKSMGVIAGTSALTIMFCLSWLKRHNTTYSRLVAQ